VKSTIECFAFVVNLLPCKWDRFCNGYFRISRAVGPAEAYCSSAFSPAPRCFIVELPTLRTAPQVGPVAPQIIGVGAGTLLLVGLWTPLAGCLLAIAEVWIAFSYPGDPWIPIMVAALGVSLAMVGSGIWSIDARLFGRKHIHTPDL
jgi:putative oxidoreductase